MSISNNGGSTFTQKGSYTVTNTTYDHGTPGTFTESTPISLAEYAGQTIIIRFSANADYGNGSIFVDDLSITPSCTQTVTSSDYYLENFDSYTAGSSSTSTPSNYPNDVLPNCWQFINRSTSSTTYQGQVYLTSSSSYASSGNCLFFRSNSSAPIYAILPEFTNNISDLMLSFTYRNEGTSINNGTLLVGYITYSGNSFVFNQVHACEKTTTLTNVEVAFTGAPAGSYIAFKYKTDTTSSNYFVSIDNVKVELAPSCLRPTNLSVSDITSHSARLSWTENSNRTNWDIYHSTSSTPPTSSTTPTIDFFRDNPETIINLQPGTTYYAWVRSGCSAWSNGISFSTNYCDIIDASDGWAESFENFESDDVPECWNNTMSSSSSLNTQPSILWGVYEYNDNQMLQMYNYGARTGTAIINSPSIALPSSGTYYLGFKYAHQADCGPFTVSISNDGGSTFVQKGSYTATVTDDNYNGSAPSSFVDIVPISLSEYAGDTIIIRFSANANYGWGAIFVDDLTITSTPCGSITVTADGWTEDFEGFAADAVPECWNNSESSSSTLNDTPEYLWGVYEYDDNKMMRMHNYWVQNGTAVVNSPSITLPATGEYELSFKYSNLANCGAFTVSISDDGGVSYTQKGSYSATSTSYSYSNPGTFTSASPISLAEYAGETIIIRFAATANYGSGAIFVDDVAIDVTPTCPAPSNVDVTENFIHATGVRIEWTETGDATNWDIYYSTENIAPTAATVPQMTRETYNYDVITGLQPTTTYYAWIRSHCSDNDVSAWVAFPSFTTDLLCAPPVDVTVEVLDQGSARVEWEDGLNPEGLRSDGVYYIYYSTTNVPPTSDGFNGESIFTRSEYDYIGNLEPNTTYYLWVREVCNGYDLSNCSEVVSFTTPACEDVVVTSDGWIEDFEGYTHFFRVPCWDISASTTPTTSTSVWGVEYYDYNNLIYMYNALVDSGDAIINSYPITLPSEGIITLSFKYSHRAACGPLTVSISDDGGATFTQKGSYSVSSEGTSPYPAYVLDEADPISLTEYAGETIIIRFAATANNGSGAIFVDDVAIDVTPTCPAPSNVHVDSVQIGATAANLSWTETGDATNWDIYYSTENTAPTAATVPLLTRETYSFELITGLQPTTTYYAWVRAHCSDNDVSEWVGTSFTTEELCDAPTNVTVTALDPGAVNVSWDGHGSTGNFDLYYSTTNVAPDYNTEGMMYTRSDYEVIGNLDPNTTYYVWVREFCGYDHSNWSDVVSFTTPSCEDIVVTTADGWIEDFEGYYSYIYRIPCWDNTASGTPTASGAPAYVWGLRGYENMMMCMFNYLVDSGSAVTYSSPITLPGAGTISTLNFKYNHAADCGPFTVSISADGGATFTQKGSYSVTSSYDYYVPDTLFDAAPISLAEYAGETIIIRFAATANRGEGAIYVDDVAIDAAFSCPAPSNVHVDSVQIGATAANLWWTENGDATNWDIYYSTENTAPTAATVPLLTRETYGFQIITGLQPTTTYYAWVRAHCSDNDVSEWVGTSFTTEELCDAPTNVTVTALDPGAVNVSWEGHGSYGDYELYYSTSNVAPDYNTEGMMYIRSDYEDIGNLDPNTTYYVWVREMCGYDHSYWSEVVSFTTPSCEDIVVTTADGWIEDFEGYYSYIYRIPCWDNTASGTPTVSEAPAYVWGLRGYENMMMCMYNYYVDSGSAVTYSSPITLPGAGTISTLNFKYNHAADCGPFTVSISADGGATFTQKGSYSVTSSYDYYVPDTLFDAAPISLAEYAGETIIIRFAATANRGEGAIFVDDVAIDAALSCPAPSNLSVDQVIATSARLEWTENGSATNWDFYYSTVNTAPTAVTVPLATQENDTYKVLTDLEPTTTYYAWMRAHCGDNNLSEWVAFPSFTTLSLADTTYTVTLSVNNPDWGSVSGDGTYAAGSNVTISATPNEGYVFVDWSDGVTENPRSFVLNADVTLTANFAEGSTDGIAEVVVGTLTLSPNPASTIVTLGIDGFEGDVRIDMVDMNGRIVHRVNKCSESSVQLSVADLPQGAYFVRVVSGNRVAVSKLIVK